VTELELEPLPPELSRLLAAEKSRPDPPAAMQARVLARIGSDLLAAVPVTGPAGAGAPPALPVSPALPAPRFRLPVTVGLVALGGLGGAGVHAWVQKSQRPVAPIAAPPTPAPPLVAPPATSPDVPAAVDPAPTLDPRPAPRAPARRLPRDGELAAERALLEEARTALARGKPADALALLSRHERQFAKGRLVEERQALTILSLAADHQLDAARSGAARFKRAFPRSMLQRAIDAALDAPP
jgi:hypothetical protein